MPVRCGRVLGTGWVVVGPTWLLAPGLFHRKLTEAGADVVAAPLGVHPGVVDRLDQLTGVGAVLRSA